MKKSLLTLLTAAFVLFAAAPLAAQDCEDVSGAWALTLDIPDGSTQDVTLTLEQDGCAISGTIVGNNTTEIDEGSVAGSAVTFEITVEAGNGPLTFNWAGEVDGDAISGTWSNAAVGTMDFAGTRSDG